MVCLPKRRPDTKDYLLRINVEKLPIIIQREAGRILPWGRTAATAAAAIVGAVVVVAAAAAFRWR